ncbi:MAG: hypothetical protein ACE368_24010 [Paracoccaceae bacterium]
MRMIGALLALGTLAACSPPVPASNPPEMPISSETTDFNTYRFAGDLTGTGTTTGNGAEDIAASALAALGASQTAAATPAPTPVPSNDPSLSDEQSFAAVSSRESIESDAERLARQREAYQVIAPEPLPPRTEASGPNIVEFALSTTNTVGQKLYNRGLFATDSRAARACLAFVSDDLAQEAFLAEGGPSRDPKGLDPDGDGFACGWDPLPYRRAAATAAATVNATDG